MTIPRREFLKGAALAGIGGALAACVGGEASGRPSTSGRSSPSASIPNATNSPSTAAPTQGSLTPSPTSDVGALRRKIGSLLVVGFRGLEVADDDPIVRAIVEDGLGGVIVFDRDQETGDVRNIASPAQLADLISRIRGLAADRSFLVAVDQEGGRVARLKPSNGFPATVSAAELGQSGDPNEAYEAGRTTARTLRSVGIDWNFAPVVDLNVNPANPSIGALGRSFSTDPSVVVALAGAVIRAHREEGILTTLKHFPGLGSAAGDTDRAFVDLTATWSPRELEPFRRLVDDGLTDSVMVANALNGQLDQDRPASLSRPTVTATLRDQLGWQGLVVTDDLQAGAIDAAYDLPTALELAIDAGNDILLFANQQRYVPDIAGRAIDIVVDLVQRGRLTEAALDRSIARVAATAGRSR